MITSLPWKERSFMYIAAALLALRSGAAGDIAHLQNKKGLVPVFSHTMQKSGEKSPFEIYILRQGGCIAAKLSVVMTLQQCSERL